MNCNTVNESSGWVRSRCSREVWPTVIIWSIALKWLSTRCCAVQYSSVQYSTVQYSSVQCSGRVELGILRLLPATDLATVQYSTVQFRIHSGVDMIQG